MWKLASESCPGGRPSAPSRFRLGLWVALLGAVLPGCGNQGEYEASLPNGYQLVVISGPSAYILDASGSTVVPSGAGWCVDSYAVVKNEVTGAIYAKRSLAIRYYVLDTTTGQLREYADEAAWRDAWTEAHGADPPPLTPTRR